MNTRRAALTIALLVVAIVAALSVVRARYRGPLPLRARALTLAEATPALKAIGERTPPELRVPSLNESIWGTWLKQRDADIRARLDKGDEDSIVNLMLYGTSFTRRPRATPDGTVGQQLHEVMDGRVADLEAAIESPGSDERVQFAREVIERHGLVVSSSTREAVRQYLVSLRSRVLDENDQYARRLTALPITEESRRAEVSATLYRDRGLSSDSSLRIDFALEQALRTLRDRGELTRRPITHVAVVGPGLDFVDKAQGYDFYPPQMIQPFALADSLLRLGIAVQPSITALDISPRVLSHLANARQHAARGETYRLNLPLEPDTAQARADPALVEYWRRFGEHIGGAVQADVPQTLAQHLRARAVAARAQAVLDVTGVDVNIVVERFVPRGGGVDVVAATNVLVYYDAFEQALAVTNMVSMLAPGGLLLTNQPVPVPTILGLSPILIVSVNFDRIVSESGPHDRGDSIYAYRKQ